MGCMLAHGVPAAASTHEAQAEHDMAGSQRVVTGSQAVHGVRLASAWAQGVALPNADQRTLTSTNLQDDETVFRRVRHSVSAVTEPAGGMLSRPTPKLSGLMLVLLTAFALVLGFLSLRWHRETAE